MSVNETTSTSFRINWAAPNHTNGFITTYRLYVKLIEVLYPIPDICQPIDFFNISSTESDDKLSTLIKDLNPYVKYSVQVAAATSKGLGEYSDTIFITTNPSKSMQVNHLEYIPNQPTALDSYNAYYTFHWDLPCYLNGDFQGFNLTSTGIRANYEDHLLNKEVRPHGGTEKYFFNVSDFKPSYHYKTYITPITNVENNDVAFLQFPTFPGVPKMGEIIHWGNVDSLTAPNPTKNIKVAIDNILTDPKEGLVTYFAILVSELKCQPDPEPQSGYLIVGPDLKSWQSEHSKACVPQYQTTPKMWNPKSIGGMKLFTSTHRIQTK